jgi:four helix bundle protein
LALRFEDIPAWQEARKLTKQIYALTAAASFEGDRDLGEQMRRAATSSMRSIAAGPSCATQRAFAQCLYEAYQSVAAVQSLLYVALDLGHIETDAFRAHYEQAARVAAQVGDLEQSLVQRND